MAFPYALELLRTKALARQDAVEYTRLCDEVGVKPEDEFLYEKGTPAQPAENKPEQPIIQPRRGDSFLAEANNCLSANAINDFTSSIDEKVRILISHFPNRFGRNARQDLGNYDPAQIGALFNGMYRNYGRRK